MLKFCILYAFVSFCFTVRCYSQTTEFQGTVSLKPWHYVYKVVSLKNCPVKYKPVEGSPDTKITYETKLSNGKTEIKIENIVTESPMDSVTIYANKVLKVLLKPDGEGYANLYVDEKDKSVLYVNYYLNARILLDSGLRLKSYSPVFSCDESVPVALGLVSDRVLPADTTVYLWKVNKDSKEKSAAWYKLSERIDVYDNIKDTLCYHLVNRYDRNAKYILELDNRESIGYKSSSLAISALYIPLKYRWGYKKGNITIVDDASSSINLGAFAGWKVTKYSIINKAGTYTQRNHFSGRVGPFISISSVALDSTSTSGGKIPMTSGKQNIAALSLGLGVMLDVKGLQIGIFPGWDFGMGPDARNWNYHGKFWLGVGVGYRVSDLFAQKE